MDVKSTGTVGDGYELPRVRMGMDMKSTGTVGDGYNSHTSALLYCTMTMQNDITANYE